jgi:hypothetical protein
MNLTMVLEPPHIYNLKKDFYGEKHHLEVVMTHLCSVLMTSPPYQKRHPLPQLRANWIGGGEKGVGENNSKPMQTERSFLGNQ